MRNRFVISSCIAAWLALVIALVCGVQLFIVHARVAALQTRLQSIELELQQVKERQLGPWKGCKELIRRMRSFYRTCLAYGPGQRGRFSAQ